MTDLAQDLITIEDGKAIIRFHSGQQEAWDSKERFTFVFAGTQGGKTSFVPWWLNREVDLTASPKGDNDYLAVTATYDLFKLKLLPEMRRVFEFILHRARFWASEKVLELSDPKGKFWARRSDDPMWGRIILRSAQSPGGLESATAKAAVLDECGQNDFTLDDWEAVQRRLSISQGRVLGATTLYNRGWVKSQIYDPWREGKGGFKVVQFPSFLNPSFPREEYDRIAATMPKWKVNMFYRGEFDVPEGLIYSPFDTAMDTCPDFDIPPEWVRWGGIDFGGVHMGATCYAERPEDQHLFLCKEYLAGDMPIAEHAATLKAWGCRRWFGGSGSEEHWRREFAIHAMPIVQPPVSDVEVGITSVYGVLAGHELTVFKSCKRWLDEVGTYSRVIDSDGQATDKIADKETFHLLDSSRYVLSSIRRKKGGVKVVRLG